MSSSSRPCISYRTDLRLPEGESEETSFKVWFGEGLTHNLHSLLWFCLVRPFFASVCSFSNSTVLCDVTCSQDHSFRSSFFHLHIGLFQDHSFRFPLFTIYTLDCCCSCSPSLISVSSGEGDLAVWLNKERGESGKMEESNCLSMFENTTREEETTS